MNIETYFLIVIIIFIIYFLFIQKKEYFSSDQPPIPIKMVDVAYEYNNTISDTSLHKWMSKLSNTLTLSSLSIPGTHDTMTYLDLKGFDVFTKSFVKCQSLDLKTQLNAGIRAIDIRCRVLNDNFIIYHGSISLNINLDNVMQILTKFLTDNNSEFIIMRTKREYKDSSNLTYPQIFENYWNKYNKFFYTSSNSNPTIKELRGKIYVIQSSESERGIADGYFDKQDMFDIDTNWKLYDKWIAVKNHINKSASDGLKGKKLFISFLNASNEAGRIIPSFVASGKGIPNTDTPPLTTGKVVSKNDNTYEDFGRVDCVGNVCSIPFVGINYLFDEYLEKQSGNIKLGIIMIDFPGARLIKQIINQNFSPKINFYKPCRFGTKCSYDRGVGKIPNKTSCPDGMRDDGISCWKDSYGRGAGRSSTYGRGAGRTSNTMGVVWVEYLTFLAHLINQTNKESVLHHGVTMVRERISGT
jgi:1-phosphatidylinositol phosphodiesterase